MGSGPGAGARNEGDDRSNDAQAPVSIGPEDLPAGCHWTVEADGTVSDFTPSVNSLESSSAADNEQ